MKQLIRSINDERPKRFGILPRSRCVSYAQHSPRFFCGYQAWSLLFIMQRELYNLRSR